MTNIIPPRSARREFLGQVGMAAAALAGSASLEPLWAKDSGLAKPEPEFQQPKWDMSWLDKLAPAQYKVVFDGATAPEDNSAAYLAAMVLDQYREVYGASSDERTRAVLVFRQLGTAIGLNDSIWERYPLAEHAKVTDPATKAPARRNPYWKARPGASPDAAANSLETLTARGAIVLVCNLAATNVASALAEKTKKDPEEVRADVKRNLIPGALLMPSGVFSVIRAQNAGCAVMRA